MITDRMMKRQKIKEGFRSKLYRCSAGKLTLGYGWNVEDTGITKEIAALVLRHHLTTKRRELENALPFFESLDPIRQEALIEMALVFGTAGLQKKFPKTLRAIARQDWNDAADEILFKNPSMSFDIPSAWFVQEEPEPNRCAEIARMILHGEPEPIRRISTAHKSKSMRSSK